MQREEIGMTEGEGSLNFSRTLHEERVNWYGRVRANGAWTDLSSSAAGFGVSFTGTHLSALLLVSGSSAPEEAAGDVYLSVVTDGRERRVSLPPSSAPIRCLLATVPDGVHNVEVRKCTEAKYGTAALLCLETDGCFLPPPPKPALGFELIGDSILSGSECLRTTEADSMLTESESCLLGYGYLAAEAFGAQVYAVTRSGALVSGYRGLPSIPQYYDSFSQIDPTPWEFSRFRPDAIVLDLGTNDLLNATPEALFGERYLVFLRHVREKNPQSAIVCCEGALTERLQEPVARAVALAAAGDGRIWHFHLPCCRRTVGHPRREEHAQNGAALAAFLAAKLNLSPHST